MKLIMMIPVHIVTLFNLHSLVLHTHFYVVKWKHTKERKSTLVSRYIVILSSWDYCPVISCLSFSLELYCLLIYFCKWGQAFFCLSYNNLWVTCCSHSLLLRLLLLCKMIIDRHDITLFSRQSVSPMMMVVVLSLLSLSSSCLASLRVHDKTKKGQLFLSHRFVSERQTHLFCTRDSSVYDWSVTG